MNCSSWPVECCQKSVTGRFDLDTSEAGQLPTDYCVVSIEKLTPAPVTHCLRTLGRIDNVGEENRRENAVTAGRRLHACEKFGDLVDKLIGVVTEIRQVVDPRYLQKSSVGNAFRQLAAAFDVYNRVLRAMDYERRDVHVWQDSGDLNHAIHAHQRNSGGRAGSGALSSRKPCSKYGIILFGWRPSVEIRAGSPIL